MTVLQSTSERCVATDEICVKGFGDVSQTSDYRLLLREAYEFCTSGYRRALLAKYVLFIKRPYRKNSQAVLLWTAFLSVDLFSSPCNIQSASHPNSKAMTFAREGRVWQIYLYLRSACKHNSRKLRYALQILFWRFSVIGDRYLRAKK